MLRRVIKHVASAQIEYQGLYSIERLHLLQTYIATKFSVTRLAALIFATPWLCAATIVLLDTFPLAPPSSGTNANYVYWIRSTLTILSFTIAFVSQTLEAIPALKLSWMQATIVTIVATAGSQISSYGMSILIGFPVPFSLLLESPIWLALLWTSLTITSSNHIRSHPGALAALIDWVKITNISVSQLVVYPVYCYLFGIVSPSAQAAMSLLLGAIKIAYRYALGKTVKEQADRKAEIVSFHAEISHALFVTFSMQSAGSIWTMVVLLLVDLAHAVITLHDVQSLVSHLDKLEFKLELEQKILDMKTCDRNSSVIERAQSVIARSSCDTKLNTVSTMTSTIMKNKLLPPAKRKRGFLTSWRRSTRLAPAKSLIIAPVRVEPSSTTTVAPYRSPVMAADVQRALSTTDTEAEIVETVRRLLYLTEFVILGEFIEFIVPVIYSKCQAHSILCSGLTIRMSIQPFT